MTLKERFQDVIQKIKKFLKDDKGAPIWEYILLIGFALFVFFIIVSIIVSTLTWVTGQADNFGETVEGIDNCIRFLSLCSINPI